MTSYLQARSQGVGSEWSDDPPPPALKGHIVIILKIEVSLDSHWELQFSNPKKVQNMRKMTPHYQKAG